MFLRKFLNKKNLVNIFNKFKNYEIYGLILKKLKLHTIEQELFLSEITKKQKIILEKFNIKIENLESSLLM